MSYLAWAAIMLLVGLGLVLMELFIPSAGLLGFLAACALVASVVVAFLSGPGTGLAFTVAIALLLPVVIAFAIRAWPHTPMGRRLLLRAPEEDEAEEESAARRREMLIGAVARAKTKMLPAGAIEVNGRTVDAVSRGMPIDAGQLVRIVEVHGNRIVVVPYENAEPGNDIGSESAISEVLDSYEPEDDSFA